MASFCRLVLAVVHLLLIFAGIVVACFPACLPGWLWVLRGRLLQVGLDPGIDHMLIMQAIDSIHSRGGKVEELVSLCGGLPDPVAADNPLLYKVVCRD